MLPKDDKATIKLAGCPGGTKETVDLSGCSETCGEQRCVDVAFDVRPRRGEVTVITFVRDRGPDWWRRSVRTFSNAPARNIYLSSGYEAIFGVSVAGSPSLLDALNTGGGGIEALREHQRTFITMLRNSPIAVLTEAANEQHYEVPPEFFLLALGKHRKYSCCYYPSGSESLDEAEEKMLALTCERAGLTGTQGVVIVNPDKHVLQEYKLKQNQARLERDKLKRLPNGPARLWVLTINEAAKVCTSQFLCPDMTQSRQ